MKTESGRAGSRFEVRGFPRRSAVASRKDEVGKMKTEMGQEPWSWDVIVVVGLDGQS